MLKCLLAGVVAVSLLTSAGAARTIEHGTFTNDQFSNAGAQKLVSTQPGQSDIAAEPSLGSIYNSGIAAYQRGDYATAIRLWRFLAERGGAEYRATAQNALGLMYAEGQGVSQDFVLAYMWFSLGAARNLADAVENREIAASYLTTEQIAEAKRLAREWLEMH
jgi:TPR repeat protein